jgi:alpha-tubulin suppressor-like RCC1 family protein
MVRSHFLHAPRTVSVIGALVGSIVIIGAIFVAVGPSAYPASAATAGTYQWGLADVGGQPITSPTQVTGLPTDIANYCTGWAGGDTGDDFSLAVDSAGTLYSWGGNFSGVLGNGTTNNDETPTVVAGLPPVSQFACGGAFSVVVDTSGHIWTWGSGEFGQMADGTYNSYLSPHKVPGISTAAGVAAGGGAAVAYLTNGTVITWGRNVYGDLGIGTIGVRRTTSANSNVPVAVPGLSDIVGVSHSWQTASAVDSSGNLWIWGYTAHGQLGNGTSPKASPSPVRVSLPEPVKEASVGGNGPENGQVLALLTNGSVWAWGYDGQGQVGNGVMTTEVTKPTLVHISDPVVLVGAGGAFSVVVTASGQVMTWGGNSWGQLGDGSSNASDLPVHVTNLPGPVSVLGYGQGAIDALS